MLLNGSEILIQCLLEQGVDTIFGYPGGSVLNIYDALYKYKDKINHILTCHEQGAAHEQMDMQGQLERLGFVLQHQDQGLQI